MWALSETTDEFASDLLHSDLPLFGNDTEDKWPQAMADDDDTITIGCVSRVAFGDWMLRRVGGEEDEAEWYRVRNYGMFHCWALVGSAYERKELSGIPLRPSFFVYLGTAQQQGRELELWTLQMGARPGSDYLLLSRPKGEDGVIKAFDVLQTECPRAETRDAGSLDIILTRYCAIASRASLLRLARRMSQRPPLGALTFVAPIRDDDED